MSESKYGPAIVIGCIIGIIILLVIGVMSIMSPSSFDVQNDEVYQINVVDRTIEYTGYHVWAEHGDVYKADYQSFRNLTNGWHVVKIEESGEFGSNGVPCITEVIS